jgi:hypothetical protein
LSRRVHNEARRIPLDSYYTNDDVAALCVSVLDLDGRALRICEPSVGGGAFVRAIRRHATASRLHFTGYDLNPFALGFGAVHEARSGDFVDMPAPNDPFDWIIGNPPYSHAEAHVRHALTLAPRCAFLLRLAFLESVKRVDFWRDHQPSEVHVLSKRPSFTGGGTDSAAYGWFVWDRTKPGPTRMSILTPDGPLWRAQ